MEATSNLAFDVFWRWLQRHPNCIVRAGTPETAIYDDDDLHWHFIQDDETTLAVQLVRGKRLVGELLIEPEQVAYVELMPGDSEDEHLFELVAAGERERFAAYYFVLTHGFEEPAEAGRGRIH